MAEPSTLKKVTYVGSYPAEKSCPELKKPEYAFIGRSNVGKSSLINMLCQRKNLAYISKTPGKTRSINLFNVDNLWFIADLPGYGYAQVSKAERKKWEGMIGDYMRFRPNLMTAFVLIDIRHPLQDVDRAFINMLGSHQVPFSIVYTKGDKVKPAKLSAHVRRIENALLEDWSSLPRTFVTSAETGSGRDDLLAYIQELNEGVGIQV